MKVLFRTAAACLAAVSLASAPPDPVRPGGLLIADGGRGGLLEILRHDVRVVIDNGIAVTTVDQVFHNTEARVVEALYTFPVPKDASVSAFSMWIDGKEMVGEVVEKQRAREIYESYKRRGVDPGLLEQVDYRAFEMRIFPIAPDAEQRVQLTYYQELDVDDDACTYVYPLATSTRPGLDSRVRGRFSLTLEAKSEIPIVGIESPSHRDGFVFAAHAPGYHEASLEATGAALDRDVVVHWRLERARTGLDCIASRTGGEDGYLLLTLTAGKELEQAAGDMDYVFVSDVSGSMADDGKLATSQRSVRAFLAALGDGDRFEMISFSVTAEALFERLAATDADALARAAEFLDAQRARGGTRLRPAIELAYRYRDPDRPLNVVILSDGMTEEREHRELLAAVAGRPAGVRLFCIGVGNEVDRPLLQQVASDTGGLAAFVSQEDDFARQAKAFRRKLMHPAIADLSVAVAGAELFDLEPAVLPNLYHGHPVRLYARYRRAGPAVVTVRGTLAGAPFEQRHEVELPAAATDHPELERMWAWRRVQELLDEERREGSPGKRVPEIVRLCEGYSIASEHASFLVLENDAEYRRWRIERRNATRIDRDRAAQQRLRDRLDELRSQAERQVGPAAPPAPAGREDRAPRGPQPPASDPSPSRAPGGGAIDPVTGLVAIGLAAAVAVKRRRGGAGRK